MMDIIGIILRRINSIDEVARWRETEYCVDTTSRLRSNLKINFFDRL